MRADRLVEREVQAPPSGRASSSPSDRGVMQLERLATALWVTRELGAKADVEARAARLNEVKSHVSLADSADAVPEIDEMLDEATAIAS